MEVYTPGALCHSVFALTGLWQFLKLIYSNHLRLQCQCTTLLPHLIPTNVTIKLHLCYSVGIYCRIYTKKWNFKTCTLFKQIFTTLQQYQAMQYLTVHLQFSSKPLPIYNFHIHSNQLKSTQRVQTSAKDYGIFCNVKLAHNRILKSGKSLKLTALYW